ncbi:hypothetical protein AXF42_Ash006523 [Apostasia shenzhenica]|uniref:Uncharacterized protein n=1 Tax=Apostasia shenzhenica TaxID=1088818 RepID=A0A2I0AZC8_9ASPA|nr:hypothetical protein AXF42_Ash006523 [Apostasia shenzhenica]
MLHWEGGASPPASCSSRPLRCSSSAHAGPATARWSSPESLSLAAAPGLEQGEEEENGAICLRGNGFGKKKGTPALSVEGLPLYG